MTVRFDHVVVDTPAHEFGADGPVIASRCGAALIVARRHSSRVTALQSLLAQMDGGATTVAGLVLNQFSG
jgi:Mrp family chromosome partitioning ATPase